MSLWQSTGMESYWNWEAACGSIARTHHWSGCGQVVRCPKTGGRDRGKHSSSCLHNSGGLGSGRSSKGMCFDKTSANTGHQAGILPGSPLPVTTKLLEDLAQTIDCIHNEIGQYLIQVNNSRRFRTSSCTAWQHQQRELKSPTILHIWEQETLLNGALTFSSYVSCAWTNLVVHYCTVWRRHSIYTHRVDIHQENLVDPRDQEVHVQNVDNVWMWA